MAATDEYEQAYLAGIRPRQPQALGQGGDNQQSPILQERSKDSWADYYADKKAGRDLQSNYALQGQQIAGQQALAGQRFGYDTALQGQVGQQQEASDWRHADISTFQQRLKQASDSELLEQEQWGRMAQQDLGAYYQKQQIDQQAGIQSQRDDRQFAHEAAMHETALKGQMAIEQLRENHADFLDEAHLRQNDEEFHDELDLKKTQILDAHNHWQQAEKQQRYSQVEAAFNSGAMTPDPGSWTKAVSMQDEIDKIDARQDLTPSQKRQALAPMLERQQDLYHRGIPAKPDSTNTKLDTLYKSFTPEQQAMYPRGTLVVGPHGPQIMSGFKPAQPKAEEAIKERQAEHQDRMKESEFEHWDTRRQAHEKERSALMQKTLKEVEAETNTESEPGSLWGTNKRNRTAAEQHIEAKRRVDEVLPPDAYGNSPEEYRAKHGAGSQQSPPTDGSSASPPAGPQQKRHRWNPLTGKIEEIP